MQTTFETRIVDNDPKGLSGRGTVFRFTIFVNKSRYHRTEDWIEYSLMDIIENKIDLEGFKQPFKESQKAFDAEETERAKQASNQAKEQRKASVESNEVLDEIIQKVIDENEKIVVQYRSGKEKSLNALVGLVLKEMKARQVEVKDSAFVVSTILKERL